MLMAGGMMETLFNTSMVVAVRLQHVQAIPNTLSPVWAPVQERGLNWSFSLCPVMGASPPANPAAAAIDSVHPVTLIMITHRLTGSGCIDLTVVSPPHHRQQRLRKEGSFYLWASLNSAAPLTSTWNWLPYKVGCVLKFEAGINFPRLTWSHSKPGVGSYLGWRAKVLGLKG